MTEITLEQVKEVLKTTEETGYFPYPEAKKEKLIAYFKFLITTIESQQLQISGYTDVYHNEWIKQSAEKDALIESQKEEIDRLREREFNHYPMVIFDLEARIFKLKDDLEAAHDAIEMLPPKDIEIHERTQFQIDKAVDRLLIESLQKENRQYQTIISILKDLYFQIQEGEKP